MLALDSIQEIPRWRLQQRGYRHVLRPEHSQFVTSTHFFARSVCTVAGIAVFIQKLSGKAYVAPRSDRCVSTRRTKGVGR